MVLTCIVPNCGNTSRQLKMLRFPKPSQKELYDIWTERIEGPDMKNKVLCSVSKRNVVCENHFSAYCRIEDSLGNLNLKRGSLPTIDVPGFSEESTAENSLHKGLRKSTKTRAAKLETLDYSDDILEFAEQCMLCLTKEASIKYYKVTSKIKKSETFLTLLEGIVGSTINTLNFHTICSNCRDIVTEFYAAKRKCDEIQQVLLDYLNREFDSDDDIKPIIKTEEDTHNDCLETAEALSILEVSIAEEQKSDSDGINDEFEEYVKPLKKTRKYIRKKDKIANQIDANTECEVCHKKFSRNSALKAHMLTHGSNKPFVCEICGKAYKHNSALKVHLGMHNGINPFTCEYCKKNFTQKIALLRHIPIHTGETPHVCDLCGKRFIHRTSFRIHKLNHAGEKNFKCSICNFAFLSRSHLNRHLKRHTGEKNFACHVCGRRFAERYNLICHQKMHAGQDLEKPPEISEVFKFEVITNSNESIERRPI